MVGADNFCCLWISCMSFKETPHSCWSEQFPQTLGCRSRESSVTRFTRHSSFPKSNHLWVQMEYLHPLAGSQPLQSTCPGSWMNLRCSRTRPVRCGWYCVGLLGQCLPSGYFSIYQALLLMLGSVVISAGYCLTCATT